MTQHCQNGPKMTQNGPKISTSWKKHRYICRFLHLWEERGGSRRSEESGKRKKGGILGGWCFCWPTVRLSSDLIIICCFLILHLENHFGRDCTVWKFIWNHRVRPQLQLPGEAEARFLSNSFCFGENFCSYWRTFSFRFIIKGYQLSIWALSSSVAGTTFDTF